MVVSQDVLDALRQIGLNLYERKLWVALLSRSTSTAGELSSLAKVPHSRTYDVLESLADKGFVVIQSSKPIKYVAVSPNEALERAKNKLKQDLEVKINRMKKLQNSSVIKELEKLHKKGVKIVEPGEITGSLKGRDALHRQLEETFKNAKNNISILTTQKGLSDLFSVHGDILKKASGRGVKIRIAATLGKNDSLLKDIKNFAEIKRIKNQNLIGRFAVVDDSHVVLALTDESVHPSQDLSLWSRSGHVAGDVLGPMFDCLWENLE